MYHLDPGWNLRRPEFALSFPSACEIIPQEAKTFFVLCLTIMVSNMPGNLDHNLRITPGHKGSNFYANILV